MSLLALLSDTCQLLVDGVEVAQDFTELTLAHLEKDLFLLLATGSRRILQVHFHVQNRLLQPFRALRAHLHVQPPVKVDHPRQVRELILIVLFAFVGH